MSVENSYASGWWNGGCRRDLSESGMENPRGCVLDGSRWVGYRGCRCVAASVWWKGNGAKALDDWIVTNTMECVSGATMRTASRFSVGKVNTDKRDLPAEMGGERKVLKW